MVLPWYWSRPLRRALVRLTRNLPERVIDLLLRAGDSGHTLASLREHPHGVDLGPLSPSRGARVRTPDGRVLLDPPELVAQVPRLEEWLNTRVG